ncbi:helix-turn-helix transcriptional regulator [Wukongibacter baidiensis]|uniref:helix-turn-helix transcriptional regulator n=1 Tax=Wukongibacter baidiensis TaxID=1723361 RepID=UPI003D7F482A
MKKQNFRLHEFRRKENMTQEELAKLLGISKDYLSMIERGVRNPSFKLAKKIADVFSATVDDIFFEK